MPAKPTGAPRWRGGKWTARVTIQKTPRRRVSIDLTTCGADDEDKARERAALIADLAGRLVAAGLDQALVQGLLERAGARDGRALAAVVDAAERFIDGEAEAPINAAITLRELGEQWTEGELHRRWPDHIKLKKSAQDDRERLEAYVYPLLGDLAIPEITVDHGAAVMASLPERLAPSTRRQVAQVLSRLLRIAAYPARIIPASPLPSGFLPKTGKRKALSFLYPDEDRLLMGCGKVPLAHRMFYGFAAREGMRRGELRALTWESLDLERGAVTLDENKSDDPRAWALRPGVVRALKRWRRLRRAGARERVFVDEERRSVVDRGDGKNVQRFREHLKTAGVDRKELFARSASRQPIRLHDLRATFITLALANGQTETWVADRTGHTSSVMINRYRRAARRVAELELGALAPLDEVVPELLGMASAPRR